MDRSRLSRFLGVKRTWPLALLLAAGLALSAAGYSWVSDLNRMAERSMFESRAGLLVGRLEMRIDASAAAMHSLAGFLAAHETVSRQDFRNFVRGMQPLQGIQFLGWAPHVSESERTAYEQHIAAEGVSNFRFSERRADGSLGPAGVRGDYFPIYYIEPHDGNEDALGFDLASDPVRRAALTAAREKGTLVAVTDGGPIRGTDVPSSVLFFFPLYRSGAPSQAVGQGPRNLSGVAIGAFRLGDLVATALGTDGPNTESAIAIEIRDLSASATNRPLYSTTAASSGPEAPPMRATFVLPVGGRQWQVAATPLPSFRTDRNRWQAWLVLLAGVGLTILSALLLKQFMSRATTMEALVESQTAELRENRDRFQALVDNVVEGIVTIDRHGNIETFNTSAENIFGYKASEVVGRNVRILMPPPYRDEHDGYLAAYQETGVAKVIGIGREVSGLRRDGREFPLELSVGEVKTGDEVMFVGVCRDISSRKQAEAEIRAVNRELESFAYSVSHDLRAPLRGIDGFSQALLEDYGDALDKGARGFIDRIRAGTARMANLIDDLLTLSRSTRGELRRGVVDFSALAREVAADIEAQNPDRKVDIVIEPGLWIIGDVRMLRILLENLIGNAWKFTSRTPSPRIEIGRAAYNGRQALFVRDNGAGFDPAYAERLFTPFQRLHSQAEFEGTGIGLATVSRIVQRHGGEIWAEGAIDSGAAIYFVLESY